MPNASTESARSVRFAIRVALLALGAAWGSGTLPLAASQDSVRAGPEPGVPSLEPDVPGVGSVAQDTGGSPAQAAPVDPGPTAQEWNRSIREFVGGVRRGTGSAASGGRLLDSLTVTIDRTREDFRRSLVDRDAALSETLDGRLSLLFEARDSLLVVLDDSTRVRIFALSSDGLARVRRELSFFVLHSRHELITAGATARAFLIQVVNAPLGWVPEFLKIMLAGLLFLWWRSAGATALVRWRKRLIEIRPLRRQNVRLAKALWYFDRIREPLELLIVLAVIVSVTDVTGVGPALFAWTVAKWILIGWTAVLLVDAFAARSPAARRDPVGLRRRSLWLLCWWIVAYGLGRQLVRDFFGPGALYQWITTALLILLAVVVLVLIRWWRGEVNERLDVPTTPRFLRTMAARGSGLRSYPATLLGGAYLLFDGARRSVVRVLAQSEVGRRGLAYLTRSEIARQALREKAAVQGSPIPADTRGTLLNGDAPLVEKVGRDTLATLLELLEAFPGTVAGVAGDRGSGKSRLMQRLVEKLERQALLVRCPFGPFAELQAAIAQQLDLAADAKSDQVGKALETESVEVVIIDDLHRLARPVIGGIREMERVRGLIRAADPKLSWVFTVDSIAWEYVRRFRERDPLHNHMLFLDPWHEDEIGRLITARNRAADLDPDFSRLVLPRQLDDGSYDNASSRNQAGFYRILWDDADGNPEAALRLWVDSLVVADGGETVVRLAHPPKATDLEGLESEMFFVLRTLLRLERATPQDIADCLPMTVDQVEDILRYARSRDMVEEDAQGRLSVSWRWDRAVRRALARRNMIA